MFKDSDFLGLSWLPLISEQFTKTHSKGGAYSEGGAYLKEGAKSNHYGTYVNNSHRPHINTIKRTRQGT